MTSSSSGWPTLQDAEEHEQTVDTRGWVGISEIYCPCRMRAIWVSIGYLYESSQSSHIGAGIGFDEDDADDSKFAPVGVNPDENPSAKLGEHSTGGQREATLVNKAGHVVKWDRVYCQRPLEKNSWEEHQAYLKQQRQQHGDKEKRRTFKYRIDN